MKNIKTAAVCVFIFISSGLKAKADSLKSQIDEINRLVLKEKGQNSFKIEELDKKIEKLGVHIARQKAKAIEPLGAVAQDSHWPLKTRVFCVNFLGLIHDPGVFPVLSKILLDSSLPDVLRSEAASLISESPVSAGAVREVLCRNFSQKNLPELTLGQTLFEIARIGCPQTDLLLKQAEDFGDHPADKNRVLAILTVKALGESFSLKASSALWRLFVFYSPGSSMRKEVLKALLKQSQRKLPGAFDFFSKAQGAVSSESRFPNNEVLALNLLCRLGGKKAVLEIQKELKNPDSTVRAAARKFLMEAQDSCAEENESKNSAGK